MTTYFRMMMHFKKCFILHRLTLRENRRVVGVIGTKYTISLRFSLPTGLTDGRNSMLNQGQNERPSTADALDIPMKFRYDAVMGE